MGSSLGQVIHGRQFSKQLTKAKQMLHVSKGGSFPVPHAMHPWAWHEEFWG